ncbi:hypothetical protein H7J07_06030 [Mycobacterium koreense]|uniref:Uncharacterized protein n=1 Tax=Mycolicibacillus koreensis TaxID=1069220 RepID=A0A7I7SCF4_9MYCO|nr:hypothetical protein [Mycolicibacillus koreensis]MCV7247785.1 hypothetical protein [Mycolicibacillus koreensis]OSC34699.1 hypothetical protein B8W67_05475 [Mycolicibacillus koreensis]BBY54170.1 hypothetical protein MKOR_14210 [Mycolicibacillus koreensis]
MAEKYRLQFCHDGRDITADFHADTDATTVRVWDAGDLVCVAVSAQPGGWGYEASDYGADPAWDIDRRFGSWREALEAFGYGDVE